MVLFLDNPPKIIFSIYREKFVASHSFVFGEFCFFLYAFFLKKFERVSAPPRNRYFCTFHLCAVFSIKNVYFFPRKSLRSMYPLILRRQKKTDARWKKTHFSITHTIFPKKYQKLNIPRKRITFESTILKGDFEIFSASFTNYMSSVEFFPFVDFALTSMRRCAFFLMKIGLF